MSYDKCIMLATGWSVKSMEGSLICHVNGRICHLKKSSRKVSDCCIVILCTLVKDALLLYGGLLPFTAGLPLRDIYPYVAVMPYGAKMPLTGLTLSGSVLREEVTAVTVLLVYFPCRSKKFKKSI